MSFTLSPSMISMMMGSPKDRLQKVLQENKGRYTINKNGYVSLDMSNTEVQKRLAESIESLRDIPEETKE